MLRHARRDERYTHHQRRDGGIPNRQLGRIVPCFQGVRLARDRTSKDQRFNDDGWNVDCCPVRQDVEKVGKSRVEVVRADNGDREENG